MRQPVSGNPTVDAYLARGFRRVRGMSSRFATAVSAWCLDHQAAHGVKGHFAEIGAFQGRYFIALALALKPREKALGIDLFNWPDERCLDIFEANCARWGILPPARITWKAHSGELTPADIHRKLGPGEVRFFHIDGEHAEAALLKDLELAKAVLHPKGLICLDDMLHPEYPFLVATVERWLKANPDFRLMCVIDREDIVAAPKFLLCRSRAVALYERPLMERFASYQYIMGGDALGHHCVVLTLKPRLAKVS